MESKQDGQAIDENASVSRGVARVVGIADQDELDIEGSRAPAEVSSV